MAKIKSQEIKLDLLPFLLFLIIVPLTITVGILPFAGGWGWKIIDEAK